LGLERERRKKKEKEEVELRESFSFLALSSFSLVRRKRKRNLLLHSLTSAREPVGELDVVLEHEVLGVGVGERHGRVEHAREAVVLGGVRGLEKEKGGG